MSVSHVPKKLVSFFFNMDIANKATPKTACQSPRSMQVWTRLMANMSHYVGCVTSDPVHGNLRWHLYMPSVALAMQTSWDYENSGNRDIIEWAGIVGRVWKKKPLQTLRSKYKRNISLYSFIVEPINRFERLSSCYYVIEWAPYHKNWLTTLRFGIKNFD